MMPSLIQKLILNCDLLGSQLEFKIDGKTRFKTLPGGIVSILLCIFCLVCVFLFGQDIVLKQKPLSRFSKIYNQNEVKLKDFPVVFFFNDFNGKAIDNLFSYIKLEPVYYELDWDEVNQKNIIGLSTLFVEKCNSTHFGNYTDMFTNPANKVPYKDSYCVNPRKIKRADGTIEEKEIIIKNEHATFPSKFVQFRVRLCINETDDYQCAPKDKYDALLNQMFALPYYLNNFVDVNNNTHPNLPFITNLAQGLNKGFTKANYMKIKNTFVNTDTGFIFEDKATKQFYQVEENRSDILNYPNIILNFYLNGSSITDNYYRQYIKVQDIIAYIGGIVKVLFTLSGFVVESYSFKRAEFFLTNEIFHIKKDYSKDSSCLVNNSSIVNSKLNKDTNVMTVIKSNNNIINSQQTNNRHMYSECKLNVFDYLRAKLNCKSTYTNKQYLSFSKIINDKFEIKELIEKLYSMDFMLNENRENSTSVKNKIVLLDSNEQFLPEILRKDTSAINLMRIKRLDKI
jgi:hypothetical protein